MSRHDGLCWPHLQAARRDMSRHGAICNCEGPEPVPCPVHGWGEDLPEWLLAAWPNCRVADCEWKIYDKRGLCWPHLQAARRDMSRHGEKTFTR